MKPILSEALGSIWLCYLTVNQLLFDAAEQNPTTKSSFDPFPSISSQKAAVRRGLLASTALVLACAMSSPAWGQSKGSPRQGELLAGLVPRAGLAWLCPAPAPGQPKGFGFHSHTNTAAPLALSVATVRTKPSLAQGRCLLKGCPGLGGKEPFWCCLAVTL